MHRFRITVEPVTAEDSSQEMLSFEVTNHDDILEIVGRSSSRLGLSEDETKAMMVGLKLLSEVTLKHRTREPFSQLRPSLRELTLQVKNEKKEAATAS